MDKIRTIKNLIFIIAVMLFTLCANSHRKGNAFIERAKLTQINVDASTINNLISNTKNNKIKI